MMKKLLIICTMALVSFSMNAQEETSKAKLTKKTTEKSVTTAKNETTKATTTIKKDAAKESASIKKAALKTTPETKKSLFSKTKTRDKSAGSYNGKKLYRGPKGGTYYINSNGNKTYIDRK